MHSLRRAVTVLSIYLFQKGTGDWYVDSALSFTLSMTMLATVTETGELMAVPNTCLRNSSLYARLVTFRLNWKSLLC